MLKCLLVASYEEPPRSFIKPQLGLIWMKKAALRAGVVAQIEIIDPQLEGPQSAKLATEQIWDLIGFYTTYPTLLNSIDLMIHAWRAHKHRERRPVLLAGGPGAAFASLLEISPVDIVVNGEAEKLWVELLRRLVDANVVGPISHQSLQVFDELPGSYKLRCRAADATTEMRQYSADKASATLSSEELDSLLEPEPWELLMHQPYITWTSNTLHHAYGFPIYATRGCSQPGCMFCSSFQLIDSRGGTRAPHPGTLLRAFQLAALDPLNVRSFILEDDTFVWNRDWMVEVCQLVLQAKIAGTLARDVSFVVKSRVDQFDEALINVMVEAGFDQINVGVESGSATVLRRLAKIADPGAYLEKVREITKWIAEYGLKVHAYMIFFTPDSTVDDLILTMELGAHLLDVGAEISTYETILALPGSPYEHVWGRGRLILESERLENPLFETSMQGDGLTFFHQEFGQLPYFVELPRYLVPLDPLMRDVLALARSTFPGIWADFATRFGWKGSTSARNGLVRIWSYVDAIRALLPCGFESVRVASLEDHLSHAIARMDTGPEASPENQGCSDDNFLPMRSP